VTTTAVFFDVDFTLIRPGRRFLGPGYAETCARHGVPVDEAAFSVAVAASSSLLDTADQRYHDEFFVRYTTRIIELMGGQGPGVAIAAREIYDDWAHHHHFEMYDDVPETLRALQRQGVRMGVDLQLPPVFGWLSGAFRPAWTDDGGGLVGRVRGHEA
jgi:phosphoglycolate phosphatase-like HAD superfamily hydrolase